MLVEITVQNLVIVSQATLHPGSGLVVVSGETGAGKSLLLDALGLLLGSRAERELVGPGGDSTTVAAVFALGEDLGRRIEAATGIPNADGQLVLRRRLTALGRSQAWVNDVPVTLAILRTLAPMLVEIRAQNEALGLAEPVRQLELIDAFGGLTKEAAAYTVFHERVAELTATLAQLDGGERESLRELDYLRFQAEEFTALDPRPGELAELENRQRMLTSAGDWQALAAEAVEALSEGEAALVRRLGSLARRLADAPDAALAEASAACQQAAEAAQDAARTCADAAERIQADPADLHRVEERLDIYYALMRKHGEGADALLSARDHITARIAALEGLSERREACARDLDAATRERETRGRALATKRTKAAAKLITSVHKELADLGMPKARLVLHEASESRPTAHAFIAQSLHVATNPGLPPAALGDIASGGETSRLMLAIAAALAEHDRTPVLVFDEIDSGVGGRLGAAIGGKLADLGHHRTVMAITHTPQLAAAADRHYVVRKQQDDHRTTATVTEIRGEDRISELAEMLGGGSAARGQAKSLLAKGTA